MVRGTWRMVMLGYGGGGHGGGREREAEEERDSDFLPGTLGYLMRRDCVAFNLNL